jgi:hypothetical protein
MRRFTGGQAANRRLQQLWGACVVAARADNSWHADMRASWIIVMLIRKALVAKTWLLRSQVDHSRHSAMRRFLVHLAFIRGE